MKHKIFQSFALLCAMILATNQGWAAPTAAPTAPTYPANQVKAVYSATYSADCTFGEWGSGTAYTQDTYGKKFVTGNFGYFGLQIADPGQGLNCSKMEALHLDVYSDAAGSIGIVPIREVVQTDIRVTKSLTAGQWNSIDIALSEFTGVTNWTDVYQIKIDNAPSMTLWLNNVYFYTTVAPGQDTEAPTAFTASLSSASYVSAIITAQATDNSGSVTYDVYNGQDLIATKEGSSGNSTSISISGLTANTAYNLSVKAKDASGNVNANPVAVNFTTKALPAPATAPTKTAANVKAIYSDAYSTFAPGWFIGGWGQSTKTEAVQLAQGDEAISCTNANYLGWDFNDTLDFSGMNYVHFDMYVAAAGTVQFTPIWTIAGVTTEAVQTKNLVAGWNAMDIPLSTWSNIDLKKIFQIKWGEMPTECWIDNVYFYYEAAPVFPSKDIADFNYALSTNGAVASASTGNAYEANDNNTGSRWASNANDNEWWMVDLQAYCKFNTIQIRWETAYTKKFDLLVSNDGESWTTLKQIDRTLSSPNNYEENIEVDETTARFVKFQGITRATGWGNSFFEFRVLKASTSVLTTLSVSAAKTIMAKTEENTITLVAKDQNGKVMDPGTVEYTVTPSDMGSIASGIFTPAKTGAATIKATAGTVVSNEISVYIVTDATNRALSTNISTDNKIIAQSDFLPNGTDAFHAVDGNDGSVWQGSPTNGDVAGSHVYDSWFVVDLGGKFNLELVTIHFEGACSKSYHLDVSADNVTWTSNVATGGSGQQNYTAYHDMSAASGIRYVRFWSTEAATGWGMKMFEFQVFGALAPIDPPSGESPYCNTEVGHLFLATPDINSYVLLSIGADGKGNTIVNIKQDAAKNNAMFDYLQVSGKATAGQDIATGGTTEMGVSFATPTAVNDSITLEILWSTVGWDGRWMVQNVKVPATAPCESAVVPLPVKDIADYNYALSSNGSTAWATSGDAAKAIDGNTGSRWESVAADPQTFVVDLHAYCSFNTVQILWEGAYGKTFTIDVSNDTINWTTVATVTDQTLAGFPYLQTIELAKDTSARYVRFNGTARGTNYGYSFYEFRVYKPAAPVLTTFSAAIANPTMKVGAENAITITALDQNDTPMDPGTLTYEITPSDAGSVTNNVFTAAKKGAVSIVAKAGTKSTNAVTTFIYEGDNVAMNKTIEGAGYNAVTRANDGNETTEWQGTRDGAPVDTTTSFVIDLGAKFNIELIAIHFEGACSDAYTVETSADNTTFANAASFTGTLGISNHTDNFYPGGTLGLSNNEQIRYIRFTSTKSSTGWGMKILEFKAFGALAPIDPPSGESPYCNTEVGHLFLATPDVNSYVLLSIGADGKGNTIVNIKQDAAKNNAKFDYLQVTGHASAGQDVATGGTTEMAVSFATPTAVNDSITLEILWSTVDWGGRWMVQNVKVPATATCATAVMPLPFKNEYDLNYALTSNGGTATATSGTAANAIDGNTGTRWESATEDPQVFVVDMHAYCTFNTIQIMWEGAYGKSFTIDASNDSTTWTNIATISGQTLSGFPNTQSIDVTETSARYVRFTGTERGTGYGYSFWEFRVFKAGQQVLTTFEVKPAMDYSKVGEENALTITAKDQNNTAMNPGEITYVVSPATAGTVTNGKYVAAKKGLATITATAGTKESQFTVYGVVSDNLALSTDRLTDNRIIEQSSTAAQAGAAWDAYFAVDQDVASVYQADTTNGAGGTSFDAWFVIDLADTFNIDLIAIKFEGACAKEYTLSFSKDNVNYSTAHTYSGASGINAHTDVLSSFTASAARYIKFNVTEAATQWGVKIFDMKVFGEEYVPSFELIRGGLTIGGLGTICLPYNLDPAERTGAVFYTLNYTDGSMLYFTEETGTLEAGHAYIFEAEETAITGVIGDTAANAPIAVNGLYGTYVNMPAGSLTGKYVVAPGNMVRICNASAYLNANRAYIDLSEVPDSPTSAPGRRQLMLGGVSRGTATGNVNVNENVNVNQNGKVIVNGQLIIIRDGKLYNAQGARL